MAGAKAVPLELLRLRIGNAEEVAAGSREVRAAPVGGLPSLDQLLNDFSLVESRKPLEALDSLEAWLEHDVGGVFAMTGRGPGRVVEANPQLGVLRLDFEKEKHVPVPIDAAQVPRPRSPRSLPAATARGEGNARGRGCARPAGRMAAILEGAGAPMSVPEIKAALTGLLPEDQWTAGGTGPGRTQRLIGGGSGSRVQYRLAGDPGRRRRSGRSSPALRWRGR